MRRTLFTRPDPRSEPFRSSVSDAEYGRGGGRREVDVRRKIPPAYLYTYLLTAEDTYSVPYALPRF